MSNVRRLAELVRARNTVESNIANLIGRQAGIGTVADYLAATIFGITLVPSANHREFAGIFSHNALAGKTVDVQWHPRREGDLSVHTDPSPDYYLVFAGPKPESNSARGVVTPWLIHYVHLFEAGELLTALRERGVQLGTRTSVISQLWERAEIFPVQRNSDLLLTQEQRDLLLLFR